MRAAILRGIEADLRRYLRFESDDGNDWMPRELELAFEVEIGSAEDAIALRGVIDRVDVDPDDGQRTIIRDYKSGSVGRERAGGRWLADHQLQVGLYMLAVRKLLGLEPVAGFYQPLTGRRPAAAGGVRVSGAGRPPRVPARMPSAARSWSSCSLRSRPRRWSWLRSCGRAS